MLRAAEAAARLGLSARTVYALAASGELPCYRFGAAVRFDPADLDAYKLACRSRATHPVAARPVALSREFRAADPARCGAVCGGAVPIMKGKQ